MRVTLVISGLGGGGAERVCVNLANAWAARGHRVTILTVARGAGFGLRHRPARRAARRRLAARAEQEELSADTVAPVVRGLYYAGCREMIVSTLGSSSCSAERFLRPRPTSS